MANIFISYNRQSEPIVRSLVSDIESLGHTVWFDHELSGGQAWWDQILAWVRDCSVLVFVLSPEGLDSTACKREYTYAAELGKPVLPVLVSADVSVNLLPPALSKIEFVDCRKQDRDAAFRLARALSTIPPPGPLPDPLPKPPDAPISYLGSLTELVDSTSTLSYPDQTALLVDLKRSLRDPENTEDTRTLLRRLRKRRDLLATIADDIDELLGSPKKPIVTSVDRDSYSGDADLRNGEEEEPPYTHLRVQPRSQKVKGIAIGAVAGIVGLFAFFGLQGSFEIEQKAMAVFPIGGAIAGAISGMNRMRMFWAAMGMVVAVVLGALFPPGYSPSLDWVLVTSLAPAVGAGVGVIRQVLLNKYR